MRYINAKEREVIHLGRQGENEVETVQFDVSGWAEEYGDGTFTLLHQRSRDTAPYECPIEVDGETVNWAVRNTDTAYGGLGEAQLIYTVNEAIAKSVIFETKTYNSLDGNVVLPDPYDDWLREIHEDAEFTRENMDKVAQAEEYAEIAEEKAREASAFVGSPLVASLENEMTDHDKVYVYIGNEVGMNNGDWYYWDGTAWVDGGVYNSIAVDTDTTLSVSGKAADAKAVGDALVTDTTLAASGKSADAKVVGDKFAEQSEEIDGIDNTINQKIIETTEHESKNLLNIDNVTSGYYWSGTYRTSTDYNNTGFIEVEEGKTLTFQYGAKLASSGTRTIASMRFVDAYNSDQQSVSSASAAQVSSYTVPQGIKYVILGINAGFIRIDNSQNSAVVYSTDVVDYEPYFEPYEETILRNTALPHFIQQPVYIYKTDTQTEVIEKLVNAYKVGNRDVIFETAVYTLSTALESVSETYDLEVNEIPIGNSCRYFFNGATIVGTVDLTQHVGDSEFYCNLFGTQRQATSFEMHDGLLIATDTRYVVHDEASSLGYTYKHLYQNMEMQYITSQRQENIRKCIGGGTGKNGVVEIVGCKFITDATDSCVSYHGNATDVDGAKFDLTVRNSWFSNSIRAGALSTSQTARLFYTGNSTAFAPSTYSGWTVTEFLNEIRV